MKKRSRLEEDKNIEENIVKDVRNLFRLKKLKKETNDTAKNCRFCKKKPSSFNY